MIRRPKPCPCGSRLMPAVRYARVGAPLDVFCCFDCGNESPSLYHRSRGERNGVPYPITSRCPTCKRQFGNRAGGYQETYCSVICTMRPASFGGPHLERMS